MSMFWGKGREMGAKIDEYLKELNNCACIFGDFFTRFLKGEDVEKLLELVQKVRDSESRCDDIRHDIERHLYDGALMPGARGDIFNVLEGADKVPNKMEATCDFIYLQDIVVPDQFKADFEKLVAVTLECARAMADALQSLSRNINEAKRLAMVVDEKESDVDELERALIKRIFKQEGIELAYKMLLRDLVTDVTAIADRAENAANRAEIIAVKRKA